MYLGSSKKENCKQLGYVKKYKEYLYESVRVIFIYLQCIILVIVWVYICLLYIVLYNI